MLDSCFGSMECQIPILWQLFQPSAKVQRFCGITKKIMKNHGKNEFSRFFYVFLQKI